MRKFHLSIPRDISISAYSRDQSRGSLSAPAAGRSSKTNCYTSGTSYGTRSAGFGPFELRQFSRSDSFTHEELNRCPSPPCSR